MHDNLVTAYRQSHGGFLINRSKETKKVSTYSSTLAPKMKDAKQEGQSLRGGNQRQRQRFLVELSASAPVAARQSAAVSV